MGAGFLRVSCRLFRFFLPMMGELAKPIADGVGTKCEESGRVVYSLPATECGHTNV